MGTKPIFQIISIIKLEKKTILFLATLILSGFARADDYSWFFPFRPDERYSDVTSACIAGAKWWANANKYTFISSHFHAYITPSSGQCSTTYKNGNSVSTNSVYNAFKIHRTGTGCTLPKIYNTTTGACGSDTQKGSSPQSCSVGSPQSMPTNFVGDPINFAIGNKFQSETDYPAINSSSLNFIRNYNSLDGLWRHNYSTYLRFAFLANTTYVSLVMAQGRESFFTVSGSTVTPTSTVLGVLSKTATGWQYISTNNEHFTFDTAGKLTQWSNASGAVHQLAYSGSQVTVTDNFGNSLSFTEDADNQPLTLSVGGVQIIYAYNTNKRLTSVTRTVGGQTTQRQFHYEDNRNTSWLTGITDERGVRYATWSYDDQGRAVSSEHANGADRITVEYSNDGGASVTNELSKVANYQFQTILGVKRITAIEGEPSANCPNSNSTFTYDERGLLKTKTDNKGHLTTYDYNDRGLELSRTEAAGTPQARTVITEWHPTLFLPVTVTEPSRITTYTYDDQGRQLSQAVTQR